MFTWEIHLRRFVAEFSFALTDKFRALVIRYDCRDLYFLSAHFTTFAIMTNLRIVTNSWKFQLFQLINKNRDPLLIV